MTEYKIGDDEYTEEVNTSYDQEQPIGDEPQALNTELSNSEPIDAKTGQDFLDIQYGGEVSDEIRRKIKSDIERSESPEHIDDLIRWAERLGVNPDDYIQVFEEEGYMYEEEYFANESLNLDGTGMARATRGINPNTTPQQLLTFVYVSKSECPICKQYDGQTWSKDSPNRPVIPRLEKRR